MFKNIKLAAKLYSAFFIILILLCIVAFTGYIGLKRADNSVDKGDDVNGMVIGILEAGQEEKNFIIQRDNDSLEKTRTATQNIIEHAEKVKSKFREKTEAEQMDAVIKNAGEYSNAFSHYAELDAQRKKLMKEMQGRAVITLNHTDNIREEQISQLHEARERMAVFLEDNMRKADDANSLIKLFFEARGYEKEFIMNNGDEEWLDLHQESILKILEIANNLKSRLENIENIILLNNAIAAVKAYDGAFNSYTELMDWQNEMMSMMDARAEDAVNMIESIRKEQNAGLGNGTDKSYDDIINNIEDANSLIRFFLTSRRFEKEFILSNGEKTYMNSYQQLINKIIKIINHLKSHSELSLNTEQIDETLTAIQSYDNAFIKFAKLMERRKQVMEIMSERSEEALNLTQMLDKNQKTQLTEAYKKSEKFLNDKMVKTDDANKISKLFTKTRISEKEFILSGENKYYSLAYDNTEEMLKLAGNLKARFKSSENIQDIDEIITDIQAYQEALANYMSLMNQQETAKKLMFNSAHKARQVCGEARERQKFLMRKQIAFANTIMFFCTIAAIFIGILTAFFITSNISKSIHKILKIADALAEGDFTGDIDIRQKDEIGRLADAFRNMKEKIGYVLQETEGLIQKIQEGRLSVRGDAGAFSGSWRELVIGVNNVLDAFVNPISMTAESIDRISKGDIPEKITEDYKGDFNKIRNNLNTLISNLSGTVRMAEKIAGGDLSVEISILSEKDKLGKSLDMMVNTLQSIVMDINALTEAASEGKLDTRGDIEKFKGEYAGIVKGINKTLDAVIGPVNVTADYIDRISKGDIPDRITADYKGDFREIKNNLNMLISATYEVTEIAQEIADGNLKIKVEKRSENDTMMTALGGMIEYLQEVADITEKVSNKDLHVRVVPKSNQDVLNLSLRRMVENLRQMMSEIEASMKTVEQQNWLKTGLAELGNTMRGDQEPAKLAQNIITYLANYLHAQIGAVYLEKGKDIFQLTGCYAYEKNEGGQISFMAGEGLAGQAAVKTQSILLSDIPEDYIKIKSGIGKAVPKNILIFPLIYEEETKGVIELGTVREFSEIEMDFIDLAAENIAIAINTAQTREKMKVLLEATQQQAEELRMQQSELQAVNKELEARTRAV